MGVLSENRIQWVLIYERPWAFFRKMTFGEIGFWATNKRPWAFFWTENQKNAHPGRSFGWAFFRKTPVLNFPYSIYFSKIVWKRTFFSNVLNFWQMPLHINISHIYLHWNGFFSSSHVKPGVSVLCHVIFIIPCTAYFPYSLQLIFRTAYSLVSVQLTAYFRKYRKKLRDFFQRSQKICINKLH